MTRLADFNFVAVGERLPLPVWVLLVAGAVALVIVADNYATVAADNERLTDRVERFKRKEKSTLAGVSAASAAAPVGARAGGDAAGQKSALVTRRDASIPPWDSLLREIELAVDARVALLSVDTDATARRTRIIAEAKTIDDALAFAARLRESPLIDAVLLLAHESKKSQAIPVVGFTLQLEWSAG